MEGSVSRVATVRPIARWVSMCGGTHNVAKILSGPRVWAVAYVRPSVLVAY
jgi:hypothetical protein